jgi:hydrogenase maturation protease
MNLLVIGYGNSLRGDDGVGPQVAEQVAAWQLPQVRSLAVHQLTPELAEPMAEAEVVLFVDAQVAESEQTPPQLADLSLAGEATGWDHRWQSSGLLQLTKAVYGVCPQAYQLLIPARQFEIGAPLSSSAQAGMDWALAQIREIAHA